MAESRRTRPLATLLLAAWVLLLAGCGFQLRGSDALPSAVQRLHLSGDGLGMTFGGVLREQLTAAGAVLVAEPGVADARLLLSGFAESRRTLSFNTAGEVHEAELSARVTLRVVDADGDELLPERTIEARRELRVDSGGPVEITAEEQRLREELLRDLADQLRRQLAAAG